MWFVFLFCLGIMAQEDYMKTMIKLISALCFALILGACAKEEAISSMPLQDVMNALYEGIAEDDMPMFGEDAVITEDNVEWYLGTTEAVYEEGLAREPMISSIAHSTVLLRVEDEGEIEATMELIRNSVNTNKWICVGVDPSELVLESKGNVILMVIDAIGIKDTIVTNFENI